MDHAIGDFNNGNFDNSLKLAQEASEYAVVFGQKMNEYMNAQQKALENAEQSNEKSSKIMKYLLLGLTIVSVIICLLAARNSSKL